MDTNLTLIRTECLLVEIIHKRKNICKMDNFIKHSHRKRSNFGIKIKRASDLESWTWSKSFFLERIFVILHHGPGLVNCIHNSFAVNFGEFALQANIVDLCRISPKVFREMNREVIDWGEWDHSEKIQTGFEYCVVNVSLQWWRQTSKGL